MANKTAETETEAMLGLFHHRWSLPVLSELHSTRGSKFVTLVNRLEVSRDSLARTLKRLIDDGWIEKNPGYGHPMRPEYLLSNRGSRIGPACMALVQELQQLDLTKIGLNKWSLPVLWAICGEGMRFSDLKSKFPSISPRALTQTLKSLSDRQLIIREVKSEQFPPQVLYKVAEQSHTFCMLLNMLIEGLQNNH